MGTPLFAKNIFQKIVNDGHKILGVFTQRPKPVGRKQILCKSPVHKFAEELGFQVFTPKGMRNDEVYNQISSLKPDLIIVAAYGFIIPQSILDLPKYGCINVHASLLPRWRGAAPIHHAIMAGDKETGVTIMKMDAGMDTGDIILKRSISISPDETVGELTEKMSFLGADAMSTVLNDIDNYLENSQVQPTSGITIAGKITKDMECVDWNANADQIERNIRAFTPEPTMWSSINGIRIKILKSCVKEAPYEVKKNSKSGTILDKNFTVKCGNETFLQLLEVQPAGKTAMKASDFLNGRKNLIGESFDEKVF